MQPLSRPNRSSSPLWIALRFPFIPVEAHGLTADGDEPLLIAHKNRILSGNACALKAVAIGMPTGKAQLLLNARMLPNDECKQQALLAKLTQVIYQFTPHFEQYREDSILLEISSCLKLFKGPNALLDQLLRELQQCFRAYCAQARKSHAETDGDYENVYGSDGEGDGGEGDGGERSAKGKKLEYAPAERGRGAGIKQRVEPVEGRGGEPITEEGRIKEALEQLHIDLGIAHTRLGAWILCRDQPASSASVSFADLPQRAFTALCACELTHLVEIPSVVARLQKTGFATLGDLFLQSSFELRDRYGAPFVDHVAEVLGVRAGDWKLPEQPHNFTSGAALTRPTEIPEQAFDERFDLECPSSALAELQAIFQCLLLRLQAYLIQQQKQCEQIEWCLHSIYHEQSRHRLRIPSLHAQWDFALELTRLHFENIELPFEVDAVTLKCVDTAPLVLATPSLFGAAGDAQDEQKLLTKLNARLGAQAVCQLQYVDSHIPECSTQKIPANSTKKRKANPAERVTPIERVRPVWLLRTPQRLLYSRQGLFYKGRLRMLSGPERIQQLWDKHIVWRDYYIAQQEDASRLWVFKDLRDQQWYLHGLF